MGFFWVVSVVAELWDLQSVWSQTADRLKLRIGRARTAALGVAISVAVLGTLAGVLAGSMPVVGRVAAGGAAAGAVLLLVLRPRWSGPVLREWTRARSVSEALKSEVFLWSARIGEYRDDPSGVRLRDKTDKVRGYGADLLRFQAGISARRRDLPAVHDVTSFFEVRVTGQIEDYYRLRAGVMQQRLGRFRWVETGLGVLGAVLGGVAAAVGGSAWAPWIAVVTTVATATAVHVAATRYEFQVIEFLRTADRLGQLKNAFLAAGSRDEADRLALAAEQVISVENQGWMAKLAEDPAEQTGTNPTW